jgi:hypothetical protein
MKGSLSETPAETAMGEFAAKANDENIIAAKTEIAASFLKPCGPKEESNNIRLINVSPLHWATPRWNGVEMLQRREIDSDGTVACFS